MHTVQANRSAHHPDRGAASSDMLMSCGGTQTYKHDLTRTPHTTQPYSLPRRALAYMRHASKRATDFDVTKNDSHERFI